jgi:hypothetical protein
VSEAVIVKLALPPALVTRADLSRLSRDIESIDNDLEAQKARNHATGKSGYTMPVLSRALNDFAELNKLDLSDDQTRMLVKDQVKMLKEKAPVLHMTFAVEADMESLQKLVEYVRKEIHPLALVSVGLQPGLVGGVYLRTPNHVHDFSVRNRLASTRGMILQDLERGNNVIEVKEAPPQTPEELAEAAAELAQAGEADAAKTATAAPAATPATPAPQASELAVPAAAAAASPQPQEAAAK